MNSHFYPRAPLDQARRAPLAGSVRRVVGAILAVLIAVSFATTGGRAAEARQSGRFLLIFETSPVLKRNLRSIQQILGNLLASNLQNEIQDNDDLAVWTVDQSLHPGLFPLASWAPEDAAMYEERLTDFLGQQKYSRHADLAAVQPLLNRVAKNSERLTVLLFCDSQSRLLGTPYDSGVNETITNTAAKLKNGPVPLILVLRSYHGEYLGCSVNRSTPLNFPKFPSPTPEPAPVVSSAAVPAPPPAIRPAASLVPALIIVGTNAGTNVSMVAKPASAPPPPPATAPPPSIIEAATSVTPVVLPTSAAPPNVATPLLPTPEPAPKVVSVPPSNPVSAPAPVPPTIPAPAPVPTKVLPVPAPVLQTAVVPEPLAAVAPPERTTSTNVFVARQPGLTGTAVESPASESSSLWLWAIGGGVLAAAALVIWLTTRARRPNPSLITSTLQEVPRWPPRK